MINAEINNAVERLKSTLLPVQLEILQNLDEQFILSIKLLREHTGLGLKEAKEVVDRLKSLGKAWIDNAIDEVETRLASSSPRTRVKLFTANASGTINAMVDEFIDSDKRIKVLSVDLHTTSYIHDHDGRQVIYFSLLMTYER